MTGQKFFPVVSPGDSSPVPSGQGEALTARRSVKSYAVLDIETRLSAREVGGWGNTHLMGVSCSVVYDSVSDDFRVFTQEQTSELGEYLGKFSLVVGFNLIKFDYRVLKGQSSYNFQGLPTLDILVEVEKRLGHRLSLDHLACHTLGAGKSASGLLALKWWKEGKMDKIIEYCKRDVALTRDLYHFGLDSGYLVYQNKSGRKVRVPVSWNEF